MKILILLLLFCLTLEATKLSQYGSRTFSGYDNLYLSLKGFKSGDKVYIEVSYNPYLYYSYSISYKLSNSYYDNDYTYDSFSYLYSSWSPFQKIQQQRSFSLVPERH